MPVRALAPQVLLYSGDPPEHTAPGPVYLRELPASGKGHRVFGDGSHPTTRLCAGALDLMCRQKEPRSVLDVGTGTGILARVARARGASFIVATDIDPRALEWAKEQCALDESPVPIELSLGAPDSWGSSFELVVANILEGPLVDLAPQIVTALKPGGTLLLSGFTPLQVPRLRASYEKQALRFISEARLDEWSLLRLEK
jgi:ribosomal protein L11 methyltransferase